MEEKKESKINKSSPYSNISQKIKDIIYISCGGIENKIERLINDDINYNLKYIKVIEETVLLGENIIEEIINSSNESIFEISFEFWGDIFIKIINKIKNIIIIY